MLCLVLGFLVAEFLTRLSSSSYSINFYGKFSIIWNKISSFFYNAGFFNSIYNDIFLDFFEISYESSNKYMDKGFIEFFGPFGFYKFFKSFNDYLINTSPSVIFFDIGYMFFSLIFFFIFLFFHSKIFLFLLMNLGLIPISVLILFVGKKL
jgi:hypothetical protein